MKPREVATKIRAANLPLPSPLWGEGLGVRGDSHSAFIRTNLASNVESGLPLSSRQEPSPRKGGEGRNARLRRKRHDGGRMLLIAPKFTSLARCWVRELESGLIACPAVAAGGSPVVS